jgi:exodeoxyribonuclease V alpha subunit
MHIENDYDTEVYNGDVGLVSRIDTEEGEITRVVAYGVVNPLAMQHYMMLQRNLVSTGLTLGTRLVVLVGQRKALAVAQ